MWKRPEECEADRKVERISGESGEKDGPTRRTWREIGSSRDKIEEMREGMWTEEGEDRDFLTEEGRLAKESLVDLGSRRDWRARKVSRPEIGAEIVAIGWRAAVANRIRRKIAVAILEVRAFGGGGDGN